jgi:hypothetical protein
MEIASKVTLRHASLSTTQRYLGKVSDNEAIQWIENIYGYWYGRGVSEGTPASTNPSIPVLYIYHL